MPRESELPYLWNVTAEPLRIVHVEFETGAVDPLFLPPMLTV